MKQYLRFISITSSLLLFLLGYSFAQSNQTVPNGNVTTPVNFPGNGCVYNWINSNPSIGLPASGTGNIPSFIGSNNGNTPVTATIKATPSPAGFAYIANYGANTLTVINTAISAVSATITVGNGPLGVTVSPDGSRVYVSNANDNTVSVVNTANNQVIATIPVGKQPAEIGVSPDGSRVYVANFASNTVSIINTANNTQVGLILVPGTPQGVTVSKDGSKLYVSSQNNNTITVINTSNNTIATTINGAGYLDMKLSPDGTRLYATSRVGTIVVINTATNAIIATIPAGKDIHGLAVSADGNTLYGTDGESNTVVVINTVTGAVIATIPVETFPQGLAISPDGGILYVANGDGNLSVISTAYNVVVKTINVGTFLVSLGSFIRTSTVCTGSPVTFTITVNNSPLILPPNISYQTPQVYPRNKAITPLVPKNTGGLVPAESYGQSTIIAGDGSAGASNGAAASASFNQPRAIATDNTGNIYIADANNHLIRKITPTGDVSTLAGSGTAGFADGTGTAASFNFPTGLVVDAAGIVYVADQRNHAIRRITPSGSVTTLAGTGTAGNANGIGNAATFNLPYGIAIDATGNLYVTDQSNNSVRKITPAGVVSTFATGFNQPQGIIVDAASNVYVADLGRGVIKKITPAGVISIFAGSGTIGSADGNGTAASFGVLTGLGKDAYGNIYVADTGNNLIRKIDNAGNVTTLGILNTYGLTIDNNGYLLVADINTNQIKEVALYGFTIDKPLPAGLTFDQTTGTISGTPTVASPPTDYTVTAYNAGGHSSTVVNITVTSLPVITVGAATGSISACVGSASVSPNIQQFTVSGNNLTDVITATAPPGFQISFGATGTYGSSVSLSDAGGTTNNTVLYIRSAATDPAGNISGNVVLTSPGATTQTVAVTGVVNALPTVNPVANQTVNAGTKTTAINFAGTGNTFTWTNNTPSIGLAASGTGDIPTFTAINNGITPRTATVTVFPLSSGFAYIANNYTNTVSVINTETGTTITNITVDPGPFGVALSPDGRRAYVTSVSNGTVTVINTLNNSIIGRIAVGLLPSCICISPDGSRVYVTNGADNTISVISTSTNSVIATIPVGGSPEGVTVSPDGSRAYVTNQSLTSNSVSVINTLTNTVIAAIGVGTNPAGIAISPDGSSVYVANLGGGISVINTKTNTVSATIIAGAVPQDVIVSPDGKMVYVTNFNSNTVSVINTATNTVIATINVGTNPHGLSISSDGSRLYVTNHYSNTLSVIDTGTNTVITNIDTGPWPISVGNFILNGTGCPGTPITFTITVNPQPPTITASTANGVISACVGSASASPDVQQIKVLGSGLTGNIIATAPVGFEISLATGSGFGNAITLIQSGGKVDNVIIYVRSAATDPPGNIAGNVTLTSAGATTQTVGVTGVINVLPTANPVANQTVNAGANTTAVNFTGTGNTYTWTNNTPGIGLPASGSGDIAAFKAVNTSNIPITATITTAPSQAGYAYIANSGSNTVTVINTITKATVTTLTVGNQPYGVSVSLDGRRAYVTNEASNTVSVINTSNNTIVATVPVGTFPIAVAVSPDGSRAYVSNAQSNTVSVINTQSNTVIGTINTGSAPAGLTVNADGSYLYVAAGSTSVLAINTATNAVDATITVGAEPFAVVLSPDGKRIYVSDTNTPDIQIIDPATNKVTNEIQTGSLPHGLALSPDGSRVYSANYGDGTISVHNTVNFQSLAVIPVGSEVTGVSVNADGTEIYATTQTGASVIDAATNVITGTISGLAGPGSFGNFVTPGTGCPGTPITFTITVNPPPPSITASTATGSISACVGSASESPNIRQFAVSGTGLIGNITATAPAGFEVSLTAASGYANSVTLAQAGGKVENIPIYVRSAAADPAGNISGNVTLTSAGAATQLVAITGVVNALPIVNPVTNQIVTGGGATTAINFTGTGDTFNWTTNTPGIGVGDSGTGNIPSFATAINDTGNPMTIAITVTPSSSVTGCSGVPVTFTITVNPTPPPVIVVTSGSLAPLTTVYGTPSPSTNFSITATGLRTGMVLTPPQGFEVSIDNSTFGNTVTAPATGNTTTTRIYIRLAATTPVGSYAGNIVLSTTGAADISVAMPNSTVTPAPLTITANNLSRRQNTPNPELTATYDHFVNGDTPAQLLPGEPVLSTTAVTSSTPGEYPIIIGPTTSPNYTITLVNGILTVTADLTSLDIPNTFTPNGDGINDTWEIKALKDFPQCTVSVYTRYGSMVFQSRGYAKPWDGTYNRTALPPGVYYYLIAFQNSKTVLSGSLTILR